MTESIDYKLIDKYLIKCYNEKISAFVHGPPGIGKSAAVERVAKTLDIQLIDLRLTQMDAVDLRGLPILTTNGSLTGWAPPEELPREGSGILFLDEINLAPPSVQHAAYQLILQRRLGNYKLPPDWVCFAAGNRVEDRAHVNELPSPLANRFIHINLSPPPMDEWFKWASENNIDPRIMGFLTWKPEWLYSFNPENPTLSFPTPRSWEYCSQLIRNEEDSRTLFDYVTMAVGKKPAGELLAFVEIFSKIDPRKILRDKAYEFPKDLGELIATITAIAIFVKTTTKTMQVKYLNFLSRSDLNAEYSVLGVQLSFSRTQLLAILQEANTKNPNILDDLVFKLKGFLEWEN